jgi:hypothetical protein
MTRLDQIKQLLGQCTPAQREKVFRQLRQEFSIHPLEAEWDTKAEIFLEAIRRASELTQKMFRGVLAEAAFDVEVIERLTAWQKLPRSGNLAYDFLLRDHRGEVRVQVKLQRSKEGRPMRGDEVPRRHAFTSSMLVVETQKTRAGTSKSTGGSTRPYRFGEFDLLAVAMYPSTRRWDTFMYTVAGWLIPNPSSPSEILKYQPVAPSPNADWTDDFHTAVERFRSGTAKTISTS